MQLCVFCFLHGFLADARERNPPLHIRETLGTHLAQFICLTNNLAQHYEILKENGLLTSTLRDLIVTCNSTTELQPLTSNGVFLSRFFIRQCDSFNPKPADLNPEEEGWGMKLHTADEFLTQILRPNGVKFPENRPVHLSLSDDDLSMNVPRWLWDAQLYKTWDKVFVVQDVPDREDQLIAWPIFKQNRSDIVKGRSLPWRRRDMDEWEHTLSKVLEYRPGRLWVNPEVWVQSAGRTTSWHYDYDPHSILFQVEGSRRFHILPPESGELVYTPIEKPWVRPIDYGTWWAEPNHSTNEIFVELNPRQLLKIPNGWPHKVTYHKDHSIGYAVRSFTQCQALSMWLGQRLCVLSTLVGQSMGTTRMCFDDGDYREGGMFRALEAGWQGFGQ